MARRTPILSRYTLLDRYINDSVQGTPAIHPRADGTTKQTLLEKSAFAHPNRRLLHYRTLRYFIVHLLIEVYYTNQL